MTVPVCSDPISSDENFIDLSVRSTSSRALEAWPPSVIGPYTRAQKTAGSESESRILDVPAKSTALSDTGLCRNGRWPKVAQVRSAAPPAAAAIARLAET